MAVKGATTTRRNPTGMIAPEIPPRPSRAKFTDGKSIPVPASPPIPHSAKYQPYRYSLIFPW